MNELRKAAEMALEAFEMLDRRGGLGLDVHEYIRTKIEALRQALTQPEQEPVAWANSSDLENFDMRVRTNRDHYHTVPLYTAPPKREWIGLTDEEIVAEIPITTSRPATTFARAIEAKLKEKNNG